MTLLGKLILALLALGVQLPAKPVLVLCLCEVLPFTCAVGGSCSGAMAVAPSCCEGGAEPQDAEQPPSEPACCGCELDLGEIEADPALPAGPRGELQPNLALLTGGAIAPAPQRGARASEQGSARGSPLVSARINRPLRI